ncbi:hypothetical protein MYX82_03810 [Acidobacteria bacterium AH-259-D05]|nr:hypothetical protein [Acidobacteria bacterium AH-259-D05]
MAEKTIPELFDRKTQKKEVNWSQHTRELIAGTFNKGSVLKLIDHGIEGLEGAPYLSTLIEDEELDKDRDDFLNLCREIQGEAEKLSEENYSRVCGRLVQFEGRSESGTRPFCQRPGVLSCSTFLPLYIGTSQCLVKGVRHDSAGSGTVRRDG